MKRALLTGAAAAAVLALLSGFSLLSLTVQTPRVRWDTFSLGSSPAVRGTSFSGTFGGAVAPSGSISYGPAVWRLSTIECASGTAGTTDGGTNNLTVRVVHEDGGEDCSCSLGSTACTVTNSNFSCDCPNGITELAGLYWNLQPAGDAGCLTMPGNIHCAADLFR